MDIILEKDGFRLVLMPSLGGSVRSFSWKKENILFPAAAAPSSPLETAAFPLFPFSGRINEGRFTWGNRKVCLMPNFPPEPHAIHGQAWLAPWQVERMTAESARLTYTHTPDSWPWTYRAAQTFELLKTGLKVSLEIENLGSEPMPAGLGWHPYFPRGDAQLSANVSGIWVADEGMIPDRITALGPGTDLRVPARVDDLNLDNAYVAQPADASIIWPASSLTVTIRSSSELGHLVVYVPPGQTFFCVEPVSHAPDAVNSAYGKETTGFRTLEPGETLSASIIVSVKRNAASAR